MSATSIDLYLEGAACREHCDCEHALRLEQPMQIGSPCMSEIPEQCQIRSWNRDPFNASTVKNQQPARFYQGLIEPGFTDGFSRTNCNHGGQAEKYSTYLYIQTSILFVSYCVSDPACSKHIAKDTTCMSISDQWLLWSGSRPLYV